MCLINDKNTEFNFSHLSSLLSPPTTATTRITSECVPSYIPSPHPPLSVCLAIKVGLPIMPQLLLDLLGLAPIHSMLVNSCGSSYSITHSVPSKSQNLSSILCRQPEDVAYVAWLSPNIKATNSILSSLLPNNICTSIPPLFLLVTLEIQTHRMCFTSWILMKIKEASETSMQICLTLVPVKPVRSLLAMAAMALQTGEQQKIGSICVAMSLVALAVSFKRNSIYLRVLA